MVIGKKDFSIYNTITFGLVDRLKILLGYKLQHKVTLFTNEQIKPADTEIEVELDLFKGEPHTSNPQVDSGLTSSSVKEIIEEPFE